MTENSITRRDFGMALSAAVGGLALPTMLAGQAQAADTFREGLQIGAMGALRTTLSGADKKYDLTFDAKDFRDSTSVLLAIEQGELEIQTVRSIYQRSQVLWKARASERKSGFQISP